MAYLSECNTRPEKQWKISVAMAYYNGGAYIEEQIRSILCQLGEEDELIVSVDAAKDGSEGLLRQMAENDRRIHLVKGPGKGVVRNFEHAIRSCHGDVIFLSDQDDIWLDNKVEIIRRVFQNKEVTAVVHDALIVDQNGKPTGEKSLFTLRHACKGRWKNFIRNSYTGCCMAFRKELIPLICPIPEKMYMHDYWIGMVAESVGQVCFLKEPMIYYRRHSSNVTQMTHGNLRFMLTKRIDILKCLAVLKKRIKQYKKK